MIASPKAVQFNMGEAKECKQKVNDLEKQNEQLCKEKMTSRREQKNKNHTEKGGVSISKAWR